MGQPGEENSQSFLQEADIRAIRLLHREGVYGPKRLAELYGTSEGAIFKIIRRERWDHVKD